MVFEQHRRLVENVAQPQNQTMNIPAAPSGFVHTTGQILAPVTHIDPISTEPIMFTREQQPRVMAQIQGCRAASGGAYTAEGFPVFLSEGDDGVYPARDFPCVPMIDALCRSYDKAHLSKPIRPDGTPKDQSYYLVGYNLLDVPWQSSPQYEGAVLDPEFKAAYDFAHLSHTGYRLSKISPSALVNARILKYREQVVSVCLMIDGDLSDLYPKTDPRYTKYYHSSDPSVVEKLPWKRSPDLWKLFNEETLPQLYEDVPWFHYCTSFYTTENGWRWVAMLDRLIPVFGQRGCYEDLIIGMQVQLAMASVGVDSGCKDWTRHMRVPRCYKGNTPLGELEHFRCSFNGIDTSVNECESPPSELAGYNPELFPRYSSMDLNDLLHHPNAALIRGVLGNRNRTPSDTTYTWNECGINISIGDCPTPEQCNELLVVSSGKESQAYTKLKRTINRISNLKPNAKGNSTYLIEQANRLSRLICDRAPVLDDFSRAYGSAGLHYGNYYATKELCHVLRTDLMIGDSGVSPQLIYAIMVQPYLDAMRQRAIADPSSARSDSLIQGEAWRAVCDHFTTQFSLREQDRKDREEEERLKREDSLLQEQSRVLVRQVMQDSLQQQLKMPPQWVTDHYNHMKLISTSMGTSVAQVLNNQLYYSDPVKGTSNIIPAIRDSGHKLINYCEVGEGGHVYYLSEVQLMDEHGTSIGESIRASRLVDRNCLETLYEGGQVHIQFVKKLPGIAEDIAPIYHDCINEYLRLLGSEHVEKFLDWCACFCMIDKPLPALYLKGHPGIGKGMFIAGLEQLTARKKSAEFNAALGNFQDQYAETPLIVCDEGSSTGNFYQSSDTMIRRMIGGSFNFLNLKGIKGISIDGEFRLVLSANNADLIDHKKDLEECDIAALNGRIFYNEVHTTDQIKDLLYKAGGRNGNEHGPGTTVENWPLRIAEHIKWLQENRKVEYGERFLIDVPATEWHDNQRVSSSGGQTVCKAIHQAILEVGQKDNQPYCYIDKKHKWVLVPASEMEQYIENNFQKFRGNACQILRRISSGTHRYRTPKDSPGRGARPNMFIIDIKSVMLQLHQLNYDIDYRRIFGLEMWNAVVPDSIKAAYADDDGLDDWPHVVNGNLVAGTPPTNKFHLNEANRLAPE